MRARKLAMTGRLFSFDRKRFGGAPMNSRSASNALAGRLRLSPYRSENNTKMLALVSVSRKKGRWRLYVFALPCVLSRHTDLL